jgi:hypothetical protein
MSDDPVVVVSGLPRSGTSLVMRMLEAGGCPVSIDAHRRADESNPHGYFELEAVKTTARDAAWVGAAAGRAVKVIHALLESLPDTHRYEVLLIERDLREVVASQRAMLGRGTGSAARASDAEGDAEDDAGSIFDALRRQLDEARYWLAAQPNVRWAPISHRRLMRDPRTAAREIAQFLGRPLDLDAMAACVDPALYRARRGG